MDVSATGIAASDHPDPEPGMAVFQRVQQRAATSMPYVYEEDSTVFPNAAGRIQRRHPPLAGQSETNQQFPLAEG
eukprot:4294729-Prorocentrum_lima.AAC.1